LSKRDHRADYARRITRGLAKGLSRSEARGHPKAGEGARRRLFQKPIADDRLQIALQTLRKERNLGKAAKAAGISPERLRRYAREKEAIEKVKGRWQIRHDLPRRMLLFSQGRQVGVVLGDFDSASSVGRYLHAVREFLETNRLAGLNQFSGESVRDIAGKTHPFETRPNVLYRLAGSSDHTFEQIYRLVI
jgi:hypothetical protein